MAMSSTDKLIDDKSKRKNSLSSNIAANPLDNSNDISSSYTRLHSSHNSTISNESDISLLSLSLDKELEGNCNTIHIDELPAFEIRLISPLGRTPSPIDNEDMTTPTRPPPLIKEKLSSIPCRNNPEFVALHDINAQISPPSDNGDEEVSSLSRTGSLETIFEGVFLNTPPRQRRINPNRTNILEKVALNRLNVGKENHSPLSTIEMQPSTPASIDFSCVTNSCAVYEKHNLS